MSDKYILINKTKLKFIILFAIAGWIYIFSYPLLVVLSTATRCVVSAIIGFVLYLIIDFCFNCYMRKQQTILLRR